MCLPLLLFCLGLNPRTDLTAALTSVNPVTSLPASSAADGRPIPAPSSRWCFSLLFESSSSTPSSPPSSLHLHYPFAPSARLLNSAGHAMLQLLGVSMEVKGSLLKPREYFLYHLSCLRGSCCSSCVLVFVCKVVVKRKCESQ